MNPIVLAACGVMLGAAALVILVRLERGPSMYDRIVALDVLVAVVIATLTIWSAHTGRRDLIVVLVVLAAVGFIGSVTLARFAAPDPPTEEESGAYRIEIVRARLARVRARIDANESAARRQVGPEGRERR